MRKFWQQTRWTESNSLTNRWNNTNVQRYSPYNLPDKNWTHWYRRLSGSLDMKFVSTYVCVCSSMCERVCVRTHACMHMCVLLDGVATLYFFKASHGCTSRRWQYEGAVDSTVITSMSWRAICHPGRWVNTVRSRPLAEKQFLWLLSVTCCSPVIPHNVLLVSSVRRRTVSWSDSRTFPFVNEYLADMLLWHYSRIILAIVTAFWMNG